MMGQTNTFQTRHPLLKFAAEKLFGKIWIATITNQFFKLFLCTLNLIDKVSLSSAEVIREKPNAESLPTRVAE